MANPSLGRTKDVLLRCVREDLESLVKNLVASIELGAQQLTPRTEELLQLHWRSEDMLKDFGGYFCVRLVLDDESPLALQIMDFFCELNWLTEGFEEEVRSLQDASFEALESSKANVLQTVVDSSKHLLDSLRTVVHTCRSLHYYHMSRIKSKVLEFKRKAKSHRMFSKNVLDFHILQRGFVNLDSFSTKVELDDEPLAAGAFGSVYKGHFITRESGDPNSSSKRVSDPVAVKMMKLHNRCSSSLQNPKSGNVTESDQESALAESGNNSSESDQESAVAKSGNTSYIEHWMSAKTSNASLVDSSPSWLSEVLKLASLRHPNIVDVRGYIGCRKEYDFGIVMELMDESLHDALKLCHTEGTQLRELDMIDLMLEIAKGMRFLHERNALHLDLKPGNVLLRYNERGYFEVKLADLGLTRFMYGGVDSESCEEGSAARNISSFSGTSYYMAPELRPEEGSKAKKCTDKADVFSYGSTCFNIVACNPDMRSSTGSNCECFYKAIESGRWREWVKGCPLRRLVNVIERCWQMQASERPTFAEICLVLQCEKRLVLAGKCVVPRQDKLFSPNILDVQLPALLQEAFRFQSGSSTDSIDSLHYETWPPAGLSLDKSTWLRQGWSSPKRSYWLLLEKSIIRSRGFFEEKSKAQKWTAHLTLFEKFIDWLPRDQETELLLHRKALKACSSNRERAKAEKWFFEIAPFGSKLSRLLSYLCSLPTEGAGEEYWEKRIARLVKWAINMSGNINRSGKDNLDLDEMLHLLFNAIMSPKLDLFPQIFKEQSLVKEISILVRRQLLTPSVYYSSEQRMIAFRRAMYEETWSMLCYYGLEFSRVENIIEETVGSMCSASNISILAVCIWLTLVYACAAATQKGRAIRLLTRVLCARSFYRDDAKTCLRVDESVLPLLLCFNLT